jgi:peptidyl-prolyl cis-trans isomerase D
VLFWKETQPSRKPAFAEVREKVSADYIEGEKRKRFIETGRTIKSQLEARLKAGDTFEKAAAAVAASSGVKLEEKNIPAFTMRDRPQDLDFSVTSALDRLDKGQVSDMVVNADKGIFVYAADKKAPDLTEANPRYVETRTQLATYTARMSASAYIAELVDKELKKSEPKAE